MATDNMIIDLTNYKDRFGQRVAPGRYTVRVADAEPDETGDGRPMINLFLEVLDEGEFEGSTVVDRLLPAHEKALFRVVNFMRAIGLPTPKKRLQINLRSWIGKVLEVDLDDGNPYNGVVRSEVRGYMPSDRKVEESRDLDDLDEESTEEPETAEASDEEIDLDSLDV